MITDRFKKVILDQLEIDDFNLDDSMVAKQVPGWDSLSHARIVMSLEDEYHVRLKNVEVLNCENIGDLQELVHSKVK